MTVAAQGRVNIVGGGIAGLIAAVELARSGVGARLFESAGDPGGRARTRNLDGFLLNQGPHALYRAGALRRELDRLGIAYSGARALGGTRQGIWQGRLHDLPMSAGSLAMTSLFRIRDKVAFGRTFKAITDGARGEGSFSHWLEGQKLSPVLRQSLEALGRLTSYANRRRQSSRLAQCSTRSGWGWKARSISTAAGPRSSTALPMRRVRQGSI